MKQVDPLIDFLDERWMCVCRSDVLFTKKNEESKTETISQHRCDLFDL